MFNLWKKDTVQKIAKQQLVKRRAVFTSLKEYDEGKKEISTTHVREHLRNISTAS